MTDTEKVAVLSEHKKVKIRDKEYTLQMVPASWYIKLTDNCRRDNGQLNAAAYTEKLLKTVVIEPKVTVDDFTGHVAALKDLVDAIETFVQGLDDEKDEQGNADTQTTEPE